MNTAGNILIRWESGISRDSRRHNLMRGAPAAFIHCPAQSIERARLTHRRDSVPQPEFVHVLGGWNCADEPLMGVRYVGVRVDETG